MSPAQQLAERYASTLSAYLVDADEAGLERAYELGRDAISQGLGVIELTSIHTRALGPEGLPQRAWRFFAEALAPYEMALRGFREANQALKDAAENLERRVLERTSESMRAQEALRKTEEQLRQSQKMDAIGRLAGGVAHDFNNLLSVIISLSDIAQHGLAAGEPLLDDLKEINKAGARAAGLTKQLLMFSRQQLFEPSMIDLDELLSTMDKMLQRLIGADVELVTLRSSNLGRVRADLGSLEQVIMNLVVNARDAMPTGGRLTIETANVLVDQDFANHHVGMRVGPHVMLAVSDTGEGMDKATQSRVFEPFFTTKGPGKGTGLGLSTVFGIVKQSGGAVWLYSEPGRGTTFKIYLPCVEGEDVPQPIAPASEGDRGGGETILLVEDDTQVRDVAASILRRKGYRIIEARNAGEALLHSENHPEPIDLLLTDVVMPQMSGPELARRLAQNRPEMKIICMSGYTDDSVVRHGVLDAHVEYLQKPLTPGSLAAKVRGVLDAERRQNIVAR